MQKSKPYLIQDDSATSWLVPMQLIEDGWEIDPNFKDFGTWSSRVIRLVKFDNLEEKNTYITEGKPKVGEYENIEDFVSREADKDPGGTTFQLLKEGWVQDGYTGTKNLVQLKKPRVKATEAVKPTPEQPVTIASGEAKKIEFTVVLPTETPSGQPTSEPPAKPAESPAPPAGEGGAPEAKPVTPETPIPPSVAFKPASGGEPIAEYPVTPEAVAQAEAELERATPTLPLKPRLIGKPVQEPIDKLLLGCNECQNDIASCKDVAKRGYMVQVRSIGATLPNSCPEWNPER